MIGKRLSLTAVLLAAATLRSAADGSDVVVNLWNGKKITGELLSVRAHSLVVAEWPGMRDEELDTTRGALLEVPTRSITSVILEGEGETHIGLGILLGCFGGGMAGLLLAIPHQKEAAGSVTGDDTKSLYIIAACTIAGGGIGGIVGNAARGDLMIETSPEDPDFTGLREFARFTEGEPEFLQHSSPTLVPLE